MRTEPTIYDLRPTWGDASQTVVIVPAGRNLIRFRVRVGAGWGDEGPSFHDRNAPIREHMDEITIAIDDWFSTREMAEAVYGAECIAAENDPEYQDDWSLWTDGEWWYVESVRSGAEGEADV